MLLDSAPTTGAFALDLFAGQTREIFYLLCLNNRCRLLQAVRLQEGTVSEAVVQPRLVVEAALRSNAAQVIFTHNHPGGDPHPSREDIRCTQQVSGVMAALDIPVLDHVIVSESQWYSFVRGGEMAMINQQAQARVCEDLTPYRP
jgi:DNA repair protein RadC